MSKTLIIAHSIRLITLCNAIYTHIITTFIFNGNLLLARLSNQWNSNLRTVITWRERTSAPAQKHTNMGIIPQHWLAECIYTQSLITLWAVVINHQSPNQSATTESHQSLTAQHNVGLWRLLVSSRPTEALHGRRGTHGCDTFSLAPSTPGWTFWWRAIRQRSGYEDIWPGRAVKSLPIPTSTHLNRFCKRSTTLHGFFPSAEKHIKHKPAPWQYFPLSTTFKSGCDGVFKISPSPSLPSLRQWRLWWMEASWVISKALAVTFRKPLHFRWGNDRWHFDGIYKKTRRHGKMFWLLVLCRPSSDPLFGQRHLIG